MLSQANNERLCRSGAGTPFGLQEGVLPFFSFDGRAIDAFAPPPDLAATAS